MGWLLLLWTHLWISNSPILLTDWFHLARMALQKVFFFFFFFFFLFLFFVFVFVFNFNPNLFYSQTETDASHIIALESGMLNIRMTVNGSVYTPKLDLELPRQVCIGSSKRENINHQSPSVTFFQIYFWILS